ncbi:MAG: hypothetical protein A2W61_06340 [Deltaproteobacteria bacterium RIFCSPLOWO2_01_44_7]|nr:MAG: hypothetical protein A2W61_06340 [Deltaproteobacteria bacterium RIFCSPLOWO2_01_44_7]
MNSSYKIVITGGGSGIGEALARALATSGHSVIICGRRVSNLRRVAKASKGISYFSCDVSDESCVTAFAEFVNNSFGEVDVLINSAGLQGEIGRFDKTGSNAWKKTFEINLFGTYLVTKHFLKLLVRSKIKKIINFSGGGAFNPFPYYSAYAVSKVAVVRFSENIGMELAELGIQVNCVAPGFVPTEIHETTLRAGPDVAGKDYYHFTVEKLKSGSVPMDVVIRCIQFLISPESKGLTGKTISASFDPWETEKFGNCIDSLVNSELYTLRRINLSHLDQEDKLKNELK